jgi:tetratricopeptide (TPR) repeat protein
MPEKKKIAVSNTTESRTIDSRMNKPQVSKSTKAPDPDGLHSATAAATAAAPAWNGQTQLAGFEAAMKQFHARNFKAARDLFEQAAQGPERDVAQRAKLHISMCDRRLQQDVVTLGSAEEYYTYGVAMLNARKLTEARTSLEKAVSLDPAADHMYYALAGAQALTGDLIGAHESLKRAIEMEPRNRMAARQDSDFAPLANQPPFDSLLYPEKKSW